MSFAMQYEGKYMVTESVVTIYYQCSDFLYLHSNDPINRLRMRQQVVNTT